MSDEQGSVGMTETAPMYFPRAGNTVDSLRPVNNHLKSSEKLVTEGLTTRPEPIEVAREAAQVILQNADKIDAVLAEQGEQLDRAKVLEFATMPSPSVAAVENAKQHASDIVGNKDGVTREELLELKANFNDSMNEVANMLLDLQSGAASLEERIAKYNQRGGHRI